VSQRRLVIEQELRASPAAVWAAITDHEGMSRWLDARFSVVARREGTSVGTVRRVRIGPLAVIDEEVFYADAPAEGRPGRLVYRIVRGAPVSFHRGEMLVEPLGVVAHAPARRTRLTWDIVIASPIPGFAPTIIAALGVSLRAGLRKLDALLAA
jgi:hypothetical protein